MNKMLLTPSRGSRSGSLLAKVMRVTKLNKKRLDSLVGDVNNLVINWGNSDPPAEVMKCTLLNKPDAIKNAVNKKTAFELMEAAGVSVPLFTENMAVAMSWVARGNKVVARHTLTGSGGEGIQILSSMNDFPCEAPLYVLYVPKKSEFRMHVMDEGVFDAQRKMRRRDVPDDKVNWLVRNHDNGFVFSRNGPPTDPDTFNLLVTHATKAVKSLGLDFGAVDLIWNEKHNKPYVLEVNTAPGLEGQTVDNYCDAFQSAFKKRGNKSKQPHPGLKEYKRFNFNDFDNLAAAAVRIKAEIGEANF